MTQKATVIELKGKNALVTARRSSMCEGCEKKDGCGSTCTAGELMGAAKTMTALCDNSIGAKPGDLVEIESESRTVLGYAALVFLFPLFLALVTWWLSGRLGAAEDSSMLFALGGFAVAYVIIMLFDKAVKKRGKPDIRITKILDGRE